MKEMQQELALFSTKPLEGVPVHLSLENANPRQGKLTQGFIHESIERSNQLSESYKSKLRSSRIINIGFIFIIIAMFLVLLLGNNSPLKDAEQKLQDKYAAWEEQLKEKEQLLQEKEAQLNSAD
jgi:fucose permease